MKNLAILCAMCCMTFGCGSPAPSSERQSTASAKLTASVPEAVTPSPPVTPPPSPPIALKWYTDLWWAYEKNEAAADVTYTDKIVECTVRGTISKDTDGYYIACNTIDPPPARITPGFYCHFLATEAGKLAEAGDYPLLKVRGTCEGRKSSASAWEKFSGNCSALSREKIAQGAAGQQRTF
jgi:tRNA_anti-like